MSAFAFLFLTCTVHYTANYSVGGMQVLEYVPVSGSCPSGYADGSTIKIYAGLPWPLKQYVLAHELCHISHIREGRKDVGELLEEIECII